jgi:hypothetical protein
LKKSRVGGGDPAFGCNPFVAIFARDATIITTQTTVGVKTATATHVIAGNNNRRRCPDKTKRKKRFSILWSNVGRMNERLVGIKNTHQVKRKQFY